MWKIILADGTELTGFTKNGSNYVRDTPADTSVFEGGLSRVVFTDGAEEIIMHNAELIQQVHYSDGWYLCFRERTAEELQAATMDGVIYVAKLIAIGETLDTDDKRLRAAALYPDWVPGNYGVGAHYNAAGQVWECFQPYDNTVYPDIRPGNAAWYTFNRPLHGTSPETARPWVKPQHGTTDIYHVGECMIWTDGTVRCCKRDTDFSPEEYAPDWEFVDPPSDNPPSNLEIGGEIASDTDAENGYQLWIQPTGAQDAYNTGDIVDYNGTLYRSKIDGNVWSPEEYPQGWEIVSELDT